MNLAEQIQARAKRFPQLTGRRLYVAGKDRLGYDNLASPAMPSEVNERECSALFVVSTEIQDRDGDIMVAKGCRTENYERNPVWFFGHQSLPLPIGTARNPLTGMLGLKIEAKRVFNKIWFDQGSGEAMEIFRLVTLRLLNNTSIGFQPLEQEKIDTPGRLGGMIGWKITKWDLLECSIVGVGANPETMAVEINKSCCPASVRKAMEPWCDKGKCWANGWANDSVVKRLSTTHVSPSSSKGRLSMSRKWKKGTKTAKRCKGDCLKPGIDGKPCTPSCKVPFREFLKAAQGMSEAVGSAGGLTLIEGLKAEGHSDCVSDKISVLIGEGYDRDQAAAIAYEHCGEKMKKTKQAEGESGAGTDVQCLLLPKAKFPDQAQAAQWVEQQGYDASMPQDAGDAWKFEQFPLEDLGGSEQTQTIAEGVSAVVGQRSTSDSYDEANVGAGDVKATGEEGPGGPADAVADPSEEGGGMSGDAALLREVLDHTAAHLPSMGVSNPVRDFYQETRARAYELATTEFPEQDWGEAPEASGETSPDEEDDTEPDTEPDGDEEYADASTDGKDDDEEDYPPKKKDAKIKDLERQLAEAQEKATAYDQLAAAFQEEQEEEPKTIDYEQVAPAFRELRDAMYSLTGR